MTGTTFDDRLGRHEAKHMGRILYDDIRQTDWNRLGQGGVMPIGCILLRRRAVVNAARKHSVHSSVAKHTIKGATDLDG